MEGAPTVRGEIKKARASNYDIITAMNEFIDNSLDAGASNILIDIREVVEDGSSGIRKIIISDNSEHGIARDQFKNIFSWTFERERQKDEIGEFGTGLKSASVNIGNKLTLLSRAGTTSPVQAVADWHDMSERNVWIPVILDIGSAFFESYHPFPTGTTLILEAIRHEFFQQQKGNDSFVSRLYHGISLTYKYYLKEHPQTSIILRGLFDGVMMDRHISSSGSIMSYWFDHAPLVLESRIYVFKEGVSYEVYLQRDTNPYWESIEFIEKRKNGNNVLRAAQVHPHKNKILLDVMIFRSCTYYSEVGEDKLVESRGTVDVIRSHRILAHDIVYRSHRSDPHIAYIKHELIYTNKRLNALLGIQFNKSNGVISDGDMRYTLEYIQKMHERELVKFERQKIGRVITRDRAADDDVILDLTETTEKINTESSSSHTYATPHTTLKDDHQVPHIEPETSHIDPTPQTTVLKDDHQVQQIGQETSDTTLKDDHHIDATPAQVVMEPSSIPQQVQNEVKDDTRHTVLKRKNFSIETKLEVIKKQECRDSEFDFRLSDEIMPIDYDHKNGEASNNSTENCQALSVLTHAIKTRRPHLFDDYRASPLTYIVPLLNCITSSKHFIDAYKNGKVRVRTFDALNDRDGLFFM